MSTVTWPILGKMVGALSVTPCLLAWPVMIHHSPAPIARFQISRSVLCPVFANQQRIRWLAGDGYERHRGRTKKKIRWFYSVIRRIQATMSIDICTCTCYSRAGFGGSDLPIDSFSRKRPAYANGRSLQHGESSCKLIPNYISARGLYIYIYRRPPNRKRIQSPY